MSFMNKSAAALVLTGVSVAVSTAFAAGFQLTEQSSLGAGRAYAGAGIVGDDLLDARKLLDKVGGLVLDGPQVELSVLDRFPVEEDLVVVITFDPVGLLAVDGHQVHIEQRDGLFRREFTCRDIETRLSCKSAVEISGRSYEYEGVFADCAVYCGEQPRKLFVKPYVFVLQFYSPVGILGIRIRRCRVCHIEHVDGRAFSEFQVVDAVDGKRCNFFVD